MSLLLCALLLTEDAELPPSIVEYLKNEDALRRREVLELQAEIRQSNASADRKRLNQSIAELRSGKRMPRQWIDGTIKEGSFGYLRQPIVITSVVGRGVEIGLHGDQLVVLNDLDTAGINKGDKVKVSVFVFAIGTRQADGKAAIVLQAVPPERLLEFRDMYRASKAK